MAMHLAPIDYADAGPELRRIYDRIMDRMGLTFVPLLFRCQGRVPRLLAANWAKIEATLINTRLPLLLKELILYNISRARNCRYCTFAHLVMAERTAAEQLGLDGAFRVADSLEDAPLPSSYKAAIRVVTRCALDPLATTDADIEQLREEGFSDAEVQELMAQADLAVQLITLAEILGVEIDREFMDAIHNAPDMEPS